MVDIVAKKPLSYAGKRIAVGQTFPATQTHAKLLIRLGKAAMPKPADEKSQTQSGSGAADSDSQKQANVKKSKKEKKKERKDAYKTRALTANTGKGG